MFISRLARHRVKVLSLHEVRTEVEGPLQARLLSIVTWVARMESKRRSERPKDGLQRAVAQGNGLVGRQGVGAARSGLGGDTCSAMLDEAVGRLFATGKADRRR